MNKLVLIEGLSIATNLKFIPKNSTLNGNKPDDIDILKLHRICLLGSLHQDKSTDTGDSISINIKTFTGKAIKVSINQDDSVESLKMMVELKEGIPQNQQRFLFGGRLLQHEKSLSEYDVYENCTIHLVINGDDNQLFYIENHLSPKFDFDFTSLNDIDNNGIPIRFIRGGERYVRPCGWMRFALTVNQYLGPNNSAWLGCSNGNGEWAVSYHGTSSGKFGTMAMVGYNLATINKTQFSFAIYTTPSIQCAEKYATLFSYQGNQYKIIFQNRINPKTMIKIPKSNDGDEYWVSTREEDIRPYGICIKKINNNNNNNNNNNK